MLFFSITVGARPIALGDVWNALFAFDPTQTTHRIIMDLRLPRTLVGLLVGAALGLSGAILQGATRNPLADPGILGIEAGATLCVVLGISVFGITQLSGYVWLAFLGAGIAMVVVYVIASLGREGATPVKLALAGAAVTAAITSVTSAILITNVETLDQIRFWQVGALTGRTMDILIQVTPFILAGIVLALATSRILDGLALGDDVARGLGIEGAALAPLGRHRRRHPRRRRDRRGRPHRLCRPHRAACGPRLHRPELPLDPALLDAARAHHAARRRYCRPRDRAAG